MQFTRLRLSGFKSFVEATELHIEPGLTGLVGPNGCGKSNIVEALGWVMGETSAKRMRGEGMDDVIFAGTVDRPPRNLAEVSLQLDNAERRAPAQFNEAEVLEVIRRIERGSGSAYRVNGREVRARDVQLLFADATTGARSTALVSQGRVDALINAKPTDRRALLEEAAGITGLHSRRHEAELRLRAADVNLERLDDVMAALETQLLGLKRQARQASRYRNISGHIRRTEATLLHLRWAAARAETQAAQARLKEAEAAVARLTAAAARASSAEAASAARLPGLRDEEARSAAGLHRLAVAREGLEAEEERVRADQRQLQARLDQIAEDTAREQELAADAAGALARLEEETVRLEAARGDEETARVAAGERLDKARAALGDHEGELQALTEKVAASGARRQSLGQRISDLGERIAELYGRAQTAAAEREGLEGASGGDDSGADEEALAAAKGRAGTAREAAREAEQERERGQDLEGEARERLKGAEEEVAKLRAERDALVALLAVNEDDMWPPLIDAVRVEGGYERALGAALGDDLSFPADEAAPVHWKVLEEDDEAPALPSGAEALSRFVTAPAALTRRLAQIGVVADGEGPKLALGLKQGQRLVTRSGALWRWDGYTVSAGAPTATATRLGQRNRLDELRQALGPAEKRANKARDQFDAAHQAALAAVEQDRAARAALAQADDSLRATGEARAEAIQRAAAAASRRAALEATAERLTAELQDAERQRAEAAAAVAALPGEDADRHALAELRETVSGLRDRLGQAQSVHDRQGAEAAARAARLEAVVAEAGSWRRRAEAAGRQLEELSKRHAEVEAALGALATRPGQIAEKRAALFAQIGSAEKERDRAADALAAAEREVADLDKTTREAQQALTEGREDGIRREAAASQADAHEAEVVARIREALDCEPERTLELAELKDPDNPPDLEWAETRLARLKRERDNMGPVNLLAEQEALEVGEQLETLRTERADLEGAIARLRQGISALNREGRERLLAAFGKVDEHFRELFVRLFGGGHAELALTESDDPLEAGLEIMASPAGKRLQMMSLMSGGEQALSALALLFAMFLTNPAPICVLDEVDAPLDDNNVSRFCDLVDEIARATATRFLLVTHNPITMARMDRLFGVTMGELGISQLVSVDLASAEALREAS